MAEQLTGRVYDIQGFSVQDGPGIRTTVFLKGCPLRCPWCHSPESQEFFPQLSWIALRCTGLEECGRCISACGKGAISPGRTAVAAATQQEIRYPRVDRAICDNCGDCAAVCYPDALQICGIDYTVDALVERVCKDIPFYDKSGGGVTISGGEPLCQAEFTLEALKALKARGVHTAVDTTGYVKPEIIDAVLPYTDLFLYDLKHMDSHDHNIVVKVPNERILDNARRIAEAGGKMQIRIPLIPRFNDSEENLAATMRFCKELGEAVTMVQLLPYHNLGVMKYQRLDEDAKVMEAIPHTQERIDAMAEFCRSFGLPISVH